MKKILVIGFSVTLQKNSYFDLVKENFKSDELEYFAIGGTNLHAILYMLNIIELQQYDICILEVSTSSRWLAQDYNRYYSIIKLIINYLQASELAIGFLHFSRLDVLADDALYNAIYDVALEKNIKIKLLDEILQNHTLEECVYDGIHTNTKGSRLYADACTQLIEELIFDTQFKSQNFSNNLFKKYQPQLLDIYHIELDGNFSHNVYERGGIFRHLMIIPENESVELNFAKEYYLNGLLLKIGPETGILKIFQDDKLIIERLIYDERSYYERFFPLFFRIPNVDNIRIEVERAENRKTFNMA